MYETAQLTAQKELGKARRDAASALIVKAMQGKSRETFCRQARLSRPNFSRFLKEGTAIPSRTTLLKIAEHSGGEVSYAELLSAWGYQEETTKDQWGTDLIKIIRNVCETYTAKAPRFNEEEIHAELDTDLEFAISQHLETGSRAVVYSEIDLQNSTMLDAHIPVHIRIVSTARGLVFETDAVFFGTFGREKVVVVTNYSTEVNDLVEHPMPYSCNNIKNYAKISLSGKYSEEELEQFEEDPFYFEVSELKLHSNIFHGGGQTEYNPKELSECSLTEEIRAIKDQQNTLSLLLAEKEAQLKVQQNKEK